MFDSSGSIEFGQYLRFFIHL